MAIGHQSPARRRLLFVLKQQDGIRVPAIAAALQVSEVAVRQHLGALEADGLVESQAGSSQGRGRPAPTWRATAAADAFFPDGHADVAVELVELVRNQLGDVALQQIVQARTERQQQAYLESMPSSKASLKRRVEALAARRDAEGYMAEVQSPKRGEFLLIEHHCPICAAATSCQGFCAGELELFRNVLGKDVSVERVSHLLSGDARCAYRISRAG